MKNLLLICLLFCARIGFAQLLNTSFENWTYSAATQNWTLDNWTHADKNGNLQNAHFGTYRDSLAQSGNFALTLSRWYAYTYDIAQFANAYTLKPAVLSGYYKYPESRLWSGNVDTASIVLYLTKTIQNKRDTIGFAVLDLPLAAEYTLFEKAIQYNSANLTPDSIFMTIKPSKFDSDNGCANGVWCSFLTIDNIQLKETNNLTLLPSFGNYILSPNPTSGEIRIQGDLASKIIRVYDLIGNLILEKQAVSDREQLFLQNLKQGVYIVRIGNDAQMIKVIPGF